MRSEKATDDTLRSIAVNSLVQHTRNKQNHSEKYPWRRPWQFVLHHSLRVEAYAVQIMASTNDLTENDQLLVRIACILHDIGRLDVQTDHAPHGAHIISRYLSDGSLAGLSDHMDTDHLLRIVAGHSEKDKPEADPAAAVMKDADSLDEIGALSIFMAAQHVSHDSSGFYHALADRIATWELPFCQKRKGMLNTEAARTILEKKTTFLQTFRDQLLYELTGTLDENGHVI